MYNLEQIEESDYRFSQYGKYLGLPDIDKTKILSDEDAKQLNE